MAQLGRYKGEVADLRSPATLQTTTLRVAIMLVQLLEAEHKGELPPVRAGGSGSGRYEHLPRKEWTLVVYLRGSVAEFVGRTRDAELAARAARLLQAHTSEPPKSNRRSMWRLPVGDAGAR